MVEQKAYQVALESKTALLLNYWKRKRTFGACWCLPALAAELNAFHIFSKPEIM
jgi:hypothetical protein